MLANGCYTSKTRNLMGGVMISAELLHQHLLNSGCYELHYLIF